MNLTTIEIDPEDAKVRLREYERLIAEERTAEDEAIAAGYRAAARGHQVIRLTETVASGGFFDQSHRPRLAVARADAKTVMVTHEGGAIIYGDDPRVSAGGWSTAPSNRGALVGRHTVRVEVANEGYFRSGTTLVPMIPPSLRPRARRLHLFHVLWEVEKWQPAVPPVDPALIRHIKGDLWAVLATWDLTELERAILTARAR